MPRLPTLTAVAVLLSVVGCSKPDLEAEKRAILATDKPWMDAIAAKDVRRRSFLSEDAVVMPQGQLAVVGRQRSVSGPGR
jgi:hypothetical protein